MKNWIRRNKKVVIIISVILVILITAIIVLALTFFRTKEASTTNVSEILVREMKETIGLEEIDEEEYADEEEDTDLTSEDNLPYPDMVREEWTEVMARDFASNNGLEIAVDLRNVTNRNQDGLVISQNPSPGASVVSGARLRVTIGRYTPATTVAPTTQAPTTAPTQAPTP